MRTASRRSFGIALFAALATFAAGSVALAQESEEVIISDRLSPKRLEVSAGTIVTWRNEDRERHRMRSRQGPVEFDSGNLEPGERFSVTFVIAGEYPYRDERDDEDRAYFGTVTVVDDQPRGGPPPLEAMITLIDESYQPPALEVGVGATVTWQNIDGDDEHTVTSTDGAFSSGLLPAGSAFEHAFDVPGAYAYFCAIHPEMQGTITVVGDAPAAAEEAGPDPSIPVESTAVSIVDLAFEPDIIEVDAGISVTWTNDDGFGHTVTAREGDFDSGVLGSGDSFDHRFEVPGVHDYFCAIHPSMTATVVVREPAAPDDSTELPAATPTDDTVATIGVSILDFVFDPVAVEVSAGTTVEWTNKDPLGHTVTARDSAFDSGTIGTDETFTETFAEPGTYAYFCAIHPSMIGTITVTP